MIPYPQKSVLSKKMFSMSTMGSTIYHLLGCGENRKKKSPNSPLSGFGKEFFGRSPGKKIKHECLEARRAK